MRGLIFYEASKQHAVINLEIHKSTQAVLPFLSFQFFYNWEVL